MNRVYMFLGLGVCLMPLTTVSSASVTVTPYVIEVPEKCKNQTFCEEVINYPEDLAENLILELDFQEYKPYDDDIPMAKEYGTNETYLCKSRPQIFYPLVAKNTSGDWFFVVNRNRMSRPVQKLIVEVCDKDAVDKPCGNGVDVNFFPTYETRCQQKYFLRYMVGFNTNGELVEIVTDTPSCCDCIVKIKDGY